MSGFPGRHRPAPAGGGLAVEVGIAQPQGVHLLAQQLEHLHELGEDQRLVALGAQRFQRLQQQLELGRVPVIGRLQQRGMDARLAQPQQPLQDLHARVVQPLLLDHSQEQFAIILAGVLIDLALRRLHIHVEHTLGAGGQLRSHLPLVRRRTKG